MRRWLAGLFVFVLAAMMLLALSEGFSQGRLQSSPTAWQAGVVATGTRVATATAGWWAEVATWTPSPTPTGTVTPTPTRGGHK